MLSVELKDFIRSIVDFPNPDIVFRDVTTVLKDKHALRLAIDSIQESIDKEFETVVAPESRGFIFGMPIAYNMNKGFIPVRKPGKLPCDVIQEQYELEYGQATLEMHKDAIVPGQKVVIIDDLLATGGTMKAIINLVEKLGGEVVKIVCLIELPELNGRELLSGYDISSIVTFEGK